MKRLIFPLALTLAGCSVEWGHVIHGSGMIDPPGAVKLREHAPRWKIEETTPNPLGFACPKETLAAYAARQHGFEQYWRIHYLTKYRHCVA